MYENPNLRRLGRSIACGLLTAAVTFAQGPPQPPEAGPDEARADQGPKHGTNQGPSQELGGTPPSASSPAKVVTRTDAAFPGLTLFASLKSTKTQLIDLDGKVVHEWQHDLPPGNSCYLLADGSLMRCARVAENETFSGGGAGGRIERWTWDGERVWSYAIDDAGRLQHHDIALLPNGNVLAIAWEAKTEEQAFEAGRDVDGLTSAGIWPDMVLEIRPDGPTGGELVWEWHVWDHLVQDVRKGRATSGDPRAFPGRVNFNLDLDSGQVQKTDAELEAEQAKLRALGYASAPAGASDGQTGQRGRPGRADWLHTNSIDYDPATDLILLSMREIGELWVIDHSTTTEEARGSKGGRQGRGGELLWRWGNPVNHRAGAAAQRALYGQHDARWLGGGAVMVYDNGEGRPEGAYSRVLELQLPIDAEGIVARMKPGEPAAPAKPSWCYDGGPEGRFYSSHISGAERLPNGNTLICVGEEGRFFEVDRAGTLAWDYRAESEQGPGGRRGGPPNGGPPNGGPPSGGPPGDGPAGEGRGRGPGGQRPEGRGPEGRGPGRRGPGGRGPGGGPGGGAGGGPGGYFRASRIALDHPGLARLKADADTDVDHK
ncbi:MAG: aryl-sulfate sulfotransferase [Planctomycetota bacterium]